MPQYGKSNVDWQQRVNIGSLREKRIARAHKMLHKHGIGAAVIFNWDSGRYLSSTFNHPYAKHIPWHYVLFIRDAGFPYVPILKGADDYMFDDCPWLKDRLVTEEELAQPEVIRLRPLDDARARWKKAADQIKGLMKKHNVEGLPLSVDYANPVMMDVFRESGFNIVDGNSWILETDMVKFDEEIELMKMAASCQEAGYAELVKGFHSGMRENDAQALMAKGIYGAGAEYVEGWVVNSGPRTSPRRLNWSDRTVRPGELLVIEACHVTFCGYKVCYDRTFLAGGKPTEFQSEIYKIAAELHHKIMQVLKPGITTHDVARLKPFPPTAFKSLEALRKHSEEVKNASFRNHLGGMGIRWDGAPTCSLHEPVLTLEKNMVISYHSVYFVDGYEGVAIENSYRLTENGCENLCKWPFDDLMILNT